MKRFLLPAVVLLLGGAALTGCGDDKEDKPAAPAVPAAPTAPPPIAIPVH